MNNQGTQWERFYGSSSLGAGADDNGAWLNLQSLRPFHEVVPDDDNDTDEHFNRSIIHPPPAGEPPDVPWIDDLLPGDGFVNGAIFDGICFVGGTREEVYFCQAYAVSETVIRQRLYRTDAWGSRHTKIRDSWFTDLGQTNSGRLRVRDMHHWKSIRGEGLMCYSTPDTNQPPSSIETSVLGFFDFGGTVRIDVGFATFSRNGITGTINEQLLFMCRGDETVGGAEGFAIVEVNAYSTSPPPTLTQTSIELWTLPGGRIHTIATNPPTLTGQQTRTIAGQLTFDFANRRVLWPEMTVGLSTVGNGYTPLASRIRQLKLISQGAGWTVNNTVASDVPGFATLPLNISLVPDPDPDFPPTVAPLLFPRLVWHHGGQDQIYVDFNGRTVIGDAATEPPYYGLVRFNPDGSNPRIVSREGLATLWGEFGLQPYPNRISLGWNCRALWEL